MEIYDWETEKKYVFLLKTHYIIMCEKINTKNLLYIRLKNFLKSQKLSFFCLQCLVLTMNKSMKPRNEVKWHDLLVLNTDSKCCYFDCVGWTIERSHAWASLSLTFVLRQNKTQSPELRGSWIIGSFCARQFSLSL